MKRCVFFLAVLLAAGLAFAQEGEIKTLTIDECVQIAMDRNPTVVMEEFLNQKAKWDVWMAGSRFLPNISGNIEYFHSVIGPSSQLRIDPQTGIPVPAQPFEIISWYSSAGVRATQPIFTGGYNAFNYLQSRSLKKSADFNFEDTKQITILLVKERYYNLLKTEKLLEVAQETVRSSDESYKRAQVLYEVGKAPKSDVLQAKVQVETDRLSLIEAENNFSVAQASLNHVLGFNVDTEIKVVDNLDVPEMEVSYEDAMQNALQDHPSLNKRFYDLRAARAGMFMAISNHLPSFYWYGGYTWRNKRFDQIKDFFDLDYNYYTGVQLSIPIFQGGSRIYTTSKASLDHKSSREALNQTQKDVALEVKQAYFLVQQAKRKITVTQDAIEAAEEDLRLNREKYSLGAGTMLDLIVAQVSYTTAQSDHISSLYDYKYYVARLRKAMGKLEK